jgi:hypothetical protein
VPELGYDADPETVDWVVVQMGLLANEPALREPLATLMASQQWETVVQDDYVIVLRRR